MTPLQKVWVKALEEFIGPFLQLSPEEALEFAIEAETTCNDLGPFDPAKEHFFKLRDLWQKAAVLLEDIQHSKGLVT